jgi:hypothetical protein
MNLEITKEKVLEAASKCSTAKETLKVLFPEAFKEEIKLPDELPRELIITRDYKDNPLGLMIGYGCAPDDLRLRCVMVYKDAVTISEHDGYYVITKKIKS